MDKPSALPTSSLHLPPVFESSRNAQSHRNHPSEGRRNLNAFQRTELQLRKKAAIAAKAKANQSSAGGDKVSEKAPYQISDKAVEPIHALKEIAKAAGVSHDTMPITLYQGAILDGWNRYCAATELGLTPATVEFDGDDGAALEYTLRTNKRRNMSSSQWATVAVEAEEIRATIQAQVEERRRAKQAATQAGAITQEIVEQPVCRADNETAAKVAEVFNTNRTYINEAAKLKETSPEAFEMVKAGDVSVPLAAQFVELPGEVQQEAIAAIAEHDAARLWGAGEVLSESPHVGGLLNAEENKTRHLSEIAALPSGYKVMGGIDTDPATSEIANRTVQAAQIFTAEDNGLTVAEMPDANAKAELRELVAEVRKIIR